ncbi:MAG: hypothetical protein HY901_18610, partial [Deltaproteobacteria bacterium]|nr:hypothetical protein [Deltaproteobacteria bacterium]
MTLHRAHWRPALVLVALAACGDSAPSSQSGDAAASVCSNAAPTCLEVPQYVLECSEDGGWRARKCEDDKLCYQGACQKLSCVPNGKQCTSGGVRTCTSDGQGWSDPVACAAGTQCDDGACKAPVCTPDAVRCSSTGTPERCSANGTGWVGNNPCPTGSGCVDGTCLPSACKQGDTTCGPTTLYTCDATGKWTSTACAAGQSCVFGRCVSCVSAVTCAQWETCAEGTCTVTTPEITTREIPPGMVSTPFSFALAATGGKAPFTWS